MRTNNTVTDPMQRDRVANLRTYASAPADGTAFLKSQVRIHAHFDERMAAKKAKREQAEAAVRGTHLTTTVGDLFPQEG